MLVSGLCLIHCIATPFIFIAQTCTRTCCAETPVWWKTMDYIFLVVSLAAVWFSAKETSKSWLKIILWINWVLLALVLIFEETAIEIFFDKIVLVPAFSLIGLHFYNRININKTTKAECDAACCS